MAHDAAEDGAEDVEDEVDVDHRAQEDEHHSQQHAADAGHASEVQEALLQRLKASIFLLESDPKLLLATVFHQSRDPCLLRTLSDLEG